MPSDWLIWQVVDSAFPSGGFAHSAGLEAAHQHGLARDGQSLADFVRAAMRQQTHGVLHFVRSAWRDPQDFETIDSRCDLFLNSHVANRASRAQGRTFLMAAAGIFDIGAIRSLAQNVREKRLAVHFAPVFGSVARAMRFDEDRSLNLFAFIALRGLISAGVRLGIVGPIEGQQIQVRLSAENAPITGDGGEPAQISPMIDLLQTTQDRLYSRLFQS